MHGKDLMISSLANISDIGPSSYRQGVVVDFHCAYRQSRELYRFYQQEETFLHTLRIHALFHSSSQVVVQY
jgi:hypothetical protein